ncbi:MAG: phosphodiester glycosidase family protein [Bacteroidales bacterium]|nr:phosphodiester glycosidase family protein [Bacteroidales bacterium]
MLFFFIRWIFLFVCFLMPDTSSHYPKKISWKELQQGLFYAEVQIPHYTFNISDKKLTLIKIQPQFFDAEIYSALVLDSTKRTIEQWAKDFKLNIVINAGMYSLVNTYYPVGYMKAKNNIVQPNLKENFWAMACFNTNHNKLPSFDIIDMTIEPYDSVYVYYSSMVQSIRMIDAHGKQVIWKPKQLIYSSMIVIGEDNNQNMIIAFTRTPLSANQMSKLLLQLPLQMKTTMYLEGGPEACLYVETSDTVIKKNGSYVSVTFPTDTNTRYWNLPNVIGLKCKVHEKIN